MGIEAARPFGTGPAIAANVVNNCGAKAGQLFKSLEATCQFATAITKPEACLNRSDEAKHDRPVLLFPFSWKVIVFGSFLVAGVKLLVGKCAD